MQAIRMMMVLTVTALLLFSTVGCGEEAPKSRVSAEMVKCRDCKAKVSQSAVSCPRCGAVTPRLTLRAYRNSHKVASTEERNAKALKQLEAAVAEFTKAAETLAVNKFTKAETLAVKPVKAEVKPEKKAATPPFEISDKKANKIAEVTPGPDEED
jgi:ribosomal protein L40E